MGTLTHTDEDPEVARMLQSIADTRRERDDLRRHNEMLDRELAIAKAAIDRLEHDKDQLQQQRDDAIARSAGILAGYKAVKAAIEANDPEPKRQLLLGSPPKARRTNGPSSPALDRLEGDLADLSRELNAKGAEPKPEAPE